MEDNKTNEWALIDCLKAIVKQIQNIAEALKALDARLRMLEHGEEANNVK